jgi:hypothetical protein
MERGTNDNDTGGDEEHGDEGNNKRPKRRQHLLGHR